jgi:hypothetical protein
LLLLEYRFFSFDGKLLQAIVGQRRNFIEVVAMPFCE